MIEFESAPVNSSAIPALEEDYSEVARIQASTGSLPEYAAAFASIPGRFEPARDPVRNLRFGRVTVHEFDGGSAAELLLRGYPDVHTTDLVITYYGVVEMNFVPGEAPGEAAITQPTTLGRSRADYLHPDPRGVMHEIEFSGGRLSIVCADVAPSWVPSGSRG